MKERVKRELDKLITRYIDTRRSTTYIISQLTDNDQWRKFWKAIKKNGITPAERKYKKTFTLFAVIHYIENRTIDNNEILNKTKQYCDQLYQKYPFLLINYIDNETNETKESKQRFSEEIFEFLKANDNKFKTKRDTILAIRENFHVGPHVAETHVVRALSENFFHLSRETDDEIVKQLVIENYDQYQTVRELRESILSKIDTTAHKVNVIVKQLINDRVIAKKEKAKRQSSFEDSLLEQAIDKHVGKSKSLLQLRRSVLEEMENYTQSVVSKKLSQWLKQHPEIRQQLDNRKRGN